jgi:hypothetical protein
VTTFEATRARFAGLTTVSSKIADIWRYNEWERDMWKKSGVVETLTSLLRKMWARLTRHLRGRRHYGQSQPPRHDITDKVGS